MPHFCTRASFVVLAAASLAACATPQYPTVEGQAPREPMAMPTPNYPIVQPDAPAASADDTVSAAPSGSVQASTLPPPTGVASQPLAPLPAPVTEMVTTTKTVPAVAGKVVDAEGKPQVYEVKPGEGLDAVARRVGTTRTVLADANGLESPYRLQPGQKLKGPAVKTKAYVVERGDTLYAIARRFSVSADAIAAENGVELAAPISVGQKLLLPSGFKDKGPQTRTITVSEPRVVTPMPTTTATATPPAAVTARPYTPTVTTPPATVTPKPYTPPVTTPKPYTPPPAPTTVTPKPYTPPATTPRPTTSNPLVTTNAPPTDNEVASAGSGRFVWPVTGPIISAFGPKGGGQRNDGINIRASANAPVRSAAAGEVVYAGDQVPGFGNLVLVKHDGGWVTAYAHLSRIDVKMRDAVMQGQQLGQVGATGGVGEPQLHFEVRYAPSPQDKARPVDPSLVLPR
ncbi:MAG TPA: peptidoglycan DD-metalloendopeptidase family protein [Caulobacteraceae bacterium]